MLLLVFDHSNVVKYDYTGSICIKRQYTNDNVIVMVVIVLMKMVLIVTYIKHYLETGIVLPQPYSFSQNTHDGGVEGIQCW